MHNSFKKTYPYLATALVLAPAVLALAWPNATHEFAGSRSVQLHGPIINFTQQDHTIRVRIAAAEHTPTQTIKTQLIIRAGDTPAIPELRIPVKSGQTYLTARLPETMAQADSLHISLDHTQIAAR